MGKINKKLLKQKHDDKKKPNFDCFVKLKRLEKSEIMKWKDGKVTYKLSIKIRKNVFTLNEIKRDLKSSATINIGYNSQKAAVEYCNVEEPIKIKNPRNLQQFIDEQWRRCKQITSQLAIGNIVLAKMKSYPPWPSFIESITANGKRAQVYFFGTQNRGTVELKETVLFETANDVIRLLLKRPQDRNMKFFMRGILEAERVIGIDDENSITKEQGALN